MALSLTIGTVTLADVEIPERRFGPLGGIQQIAVHRFPGGTKTVQSLGAFPGPVEWSGIITGPTAFTRVRELDRMRVLGLKQTVRYGPWVWIGVVSKFTASPEFAWWIPYDIAVEPIVDLSGQAQVASAPAPPESVFASLVHDLGARTADPSNPLAATAPSALSQVSQTTQTAQQTLQGAGGTLAGLSQGQLLSLLATIQSTITTLVPLAAAGPSDSASEAQAIADRLQQLVYVLAGVQTQVLAQVPAVNPNLYALASQYYGDPSQWVRIAQANRMVDPMPAGVFPALVIPL
jgi:hypothetical protein